MISRLLVREGTKDVASIFYPWPKASRSLRTKYDAGNSKGTHAHLLASDFQPARAFALTNSVDSKQAVENFPF